MKKGFTLVELLAVIVILASVSMIVFPAITAVISKSKQNLYDVQVKDIELATDKWALENNTLLDKYHLNATYLELSVLQKEGFLEVDKIENPKTREEMNGCIEIKYNESTSQYNTKYYDDTCSSLTTNKNLIADPHGYIRKYVNNELVIDNVNPIDPSGITIVKQYDSLILYEGNTTQGLYDLEDNYVFRGSDPRNYVKIADTNDLWRIISINKKDYTMKLIRTSLLASNQWDSTAGTNFENATVNSEILDKFIEENSTIGKIKNKIVEEATWNVGVVSDNEVNVNILKSLEASGTMINNAGLINISDYVLASTNNECFNNFKSNNCSSDNYLSTQFSGTTWTLNSDGSNIWVIGGMPLLKSSSDLYNIYPVIVVKPSLYITNMENIDTIGTSTNPYILK